MLNIVENLNENQRKAVFETDQLERILKNYS